MQNILHIRILKSQENQIEELRAVTKAKHGITLPRNNVIKIAIAEFLEDVENNPKLLDGLLEKYIII